jgi:hypothetical protein
MSSEVHFVSCKSTMSGFSARIRSRSIFCLLRPLRPLIFHEMIFIMTRGVGRGGKLSEIKWICPEFTINFPISCMSLLVDFLPLFFSSF